MTVYFVWRNKLLITGSFQNLEMFPEIENTVLNPVLIYIIVLLSMYILERKKGQTATVEQNLVFRSKTICSATLNWLIVLPN